MYHIFFIAKNNAKKQKGDIITLAVLALLAAFMLYSGVSVLAGLGSVMDTSADVHNTSHVYYWVPEVLADPLEDELKDTKEVREYDRTRTDMVNARYRNKDKGDGEWSLFQFYFGSLDEERKINKLGVDTKDLTDKDILIPYYLKPQYAVGDTIEFNLDDEVFGFNVAGYVEDPLFATSINISIYNVYIKGDVLDDMCDKHPGLFVRGESLKFRGDKDADIYELRDSLWSKYQAYTSRENIQNTNVLEVNWWDMKGGGMFMTEIVMAVFAIFAMLIMVIALIIISFSIRNFIERNMKNTGILEAAGYKTGELAAAIVIENAIAALTGALLGVALAALTREAFGSVVALVQGLPWNQPYDFGVAAGVVLGIVLLVVIACLVSSRQYMKVSVLDCLRGGISNHNFKRNRFPFEKAFTPVPVTLSLKELFGDKRRNLVLALIIAIIAISTNLGFAMVASFGDNNDGTLKLAGIEKPDVQITESRDIEDDLKKVDKIDKVSLYYQMDPTMKSADKEATINCDVYDDLSVLENYIMIEGRIPESDREICLTKKAAKQLGVGVGDIIYIEYGDKHADFMVSGLDQKINHMGLKGLMTYEGAQRFLDMKDEVMFYIWTKEGVTFDEIKAELGKITDASVDDTAKIITETTSTVSNSMYIICYSILAVTFMIVIFVEILLVRSKIIREYRNYGINKAIGFTSGQLMIQTMISNIPAILLGILAGSLVARPVSNVVMSAALMFFGIEKIESEIPFYGLAITLVGILAVALITAFFCSLSIRKVEPVELLNVE
ncbi:MAG: hypothetical protein J6X33_07170 [Clostridiales bacterium]|nr:hypothetical protein [Clostridiales bacterium]